MKPTHLTSPLCLLLLALAPCLTPSPRGLAAQEPEGALPRPSISVGSGAGSYVFFRSSAQACFEILAHDINAEQVGKNLNRNSGIDRFSISNHTVNIKYQAV